MRRLVALITLTALLNSGLGCGRVVNMPVAELNRPDLDSTEIAQQKTGINRVTLYDGREIRFSKPGGYLDRNTMTIRGIEFLKQGPKRLVGDSVWVPLDSVESLGHWKAYTPINTVLVFGCIVGAAILIDYARTPKWHGFR